jgi:hypothetical protein
MPVPYLSVIEPDMANHDSYRIGALRQQQIYDRILGDEFEAKV